MRKILFLLLGILIVFCKSCNNIRSDDYLESGDFLYKVVTKNKDDGISDSFIVIMGLSETGKEKEVIVVPQFINGIEVKELVREKFWATEGKWESEKLKRIYIPFLPNKIFRVFRSYCPNLEATMIIANEITYENTMEEEVYITSYHQTAGNTTSDVPSEYRLGMPACYFANVSYFYNYDEAPNCGYYWIDNYDYGNLITYIPEEPIRDGYTFAGWYKESECINKWDFDVDKTPSVVYNEENRTIYQETRLYAKWEKEE
jgi:uncharacterized repeat protein (TIGR02543 family)